MTRHLDSYIRVFLREPVVEQVQVYLADEIEHLDGWLLFTAKAWIYAGETTEYVPPQYMALPSHQVRSVIFPEGHRRAEQ